MVALGDAIIHTPASAAPGIVPRLIEAYERNEASAVFAVAEVPTELVSRYGIAIPRRSDRARSSRAPLRSRSRSSTSSRSPSRAPCGRDLAVMGRYVVGAVGLCRAARYAADAPGEVQLADALRLVLQRGERVLAVPLGPGERRHDIGSAEGYCATFSSTR